MAIKTARVQINGQWYDLTYNPESRLWEADITAPGSSIRQPGGVYLETVEATNETGNTTLTDGSRVPTLILKVVERVKPVLTVVSPPPGFIIDNLTPVVVDVTDDDSGANMDTFILTVDGVSVAGDIETNPEGFRVTWTPPEPYNDGLHTIHAEVTDYDGNTGTVDMSFIVDTIPPALDISNRHLIVDWDSIEIFGPTNDETSPPVTVEVENNGQPVGVAAISDDGVYALKVPLTIGDNNVKVTATDMAGLQTVQERLFMRLVTDRTEADVNRLITLRRNGWKNMSEEDRAWYMDVVCRGGYNDEDLNRVERASGYGALILRVMVEELKKYGDSIHVGWDTLYAPPYDPAEFKNVETKTDWVMDDIPDRIPPEQMERYLWNVKHLRAAMDYETPDLPDSMDDLGHDEANNIELAIVGMSASIGPFMARSEHLMDMAALSPFVSGEISSGEY